MRQFVRIFAYLLVGFIGLLIAGLQIFPSFEASAKSVILVIVGVVLVIDAVRSLIRYIRNM